MERDHDLFPAIDLMQAQKWLKRTIDKPKPTLALVTIDLMQALKWLKRTINEPKSTVDLMQTLKWLIQTIYKPKPPTYTYGMD